MAMVATRTMAVKLKQKIPIAVQRVFASSRAPARSSNPRAGVDDLDPELRRILEGVVKLQNKGRCIYASRVFEDFVKLERKNHRDELLACGAGVGLGGLILSLGVYRLYS